MEGHFLRLLCQGYPGRVFTGDLELQLTLIMNYMRLYEFHWSETSIHQNYLTGAFDETFLHDCHLFFASQSWTIWSLNWAEPPHPTVWAVPYAALGVPFPLCLCPLDLSYSFHEVVSPSVLLSLAFYFSWRVWGCR